MTVTSYDNRCFVLGNNVTVYKTLYGSALDVFAEGEALMLNDSKQLVKWTLASGKPIFGFIAPNCGITFGAAETSRANVGVIVSGDIDKNMIVLPSGVAVTDGFLDLFTRFIPIEALAAGVDIAARTAFYNAKACSLISAGLLLHGASAGIDGSNTCAVALADASTNAIVSKTYSTTPPTANDINDLGSLSATHKVLTAGECVTIAITNGTTAATPRMDLVIAYSESVKTIADKLAEDGKFNLIDRESITE